MHYPGSSLNECWSVLVSGHSFKICDGERGTLLNCVIFRHDQNSENGAFLPSTTGVSVFAVPFFRGRPRVQLRPNRVPTPFTKTSSPNGRHAYVLARNSAVATASSRPRNWAHSAVAALVFPPPHVNQLMLVCSCHMSHCAGPPVVCGTCHHSRPHWISLHICQSYPQMPSAQTTGKKNILPEMSCAAATHVVIVSVPISRGPTPKTYSRKRRFHGTDDVSG